MHNSFGRQSIDCDDNYARNVGEEEETVAYGKNQEDSLNSIVLGVSWGGEGAYE